MKSISITCILYSLGSICVAQKNKKGDQINTLSLEKKTPLEITSYPKNQCGTYPLIKLLRDTLSKEGFTVIDSIKSSSLQQSFIKRVFNTSALKDKNGEEAKARIENERNKKVVQQLSIENFSCLDTLHNFTIRIYLFPRPRTEEKTLSFTLPFSSPYRISDIILSLIEREPPKK